MTRGPSERHMTSQTRLDSPYRLVSTHVYRHTRGTQFVTTLDAGLLQNVCAVQRPTVLGVCGENLGRGTANVLEVRPPPSPVTARH